MSLLARRLGRRGFLAGMVAAAGATAAAALGLIKWRTGDLLGGGDATGRSTPAGIFGEWIDVDGLPALRYTLDQRTDHVLNTGFAKASNRRKTGITSATMRRQPSRRTTVGCSSSISPTARGG